MNQDALGRQGFKVSASNGLEVWTRWLSDYTAAVVLYNNNPVTYVKACMRRVLIEFAGGGSCR